MAYPPPPYKDAVAGTFVAGEAIVGAWWAYAPAGGLKLGGHPPVIEIILTDQAPAAGLKLGAWLPSHGVQAAVPVGGIKLGAYAPSVSLVISPTVAPAPAALKLGATPPALQITMILAIGPSGLALGAWVPESVGRRYINAVTCVDLVLAPDTERVLVLAGSSERVVDLDPAECR